MIPFEQFDETAYLAANPDVAAAVGSGVFSSGLRHYLQYGYREQRPGVPPALHASLAALLASAAAAALPPAHLRTRVHGNDDPASFDSIGKVAAFDLYAANRSAGIALSPGSRVLDFGCGCGRILKYFKLLYPAAELHGTDIDPEAIAWCAGNAAHLGSFTTNGEWPPLSFADGFFDYVYSVSIFTHLPEDMQFAWLAELRRVTRPGGLLLLTVHGQGLFPGTAAREREQFLRAGFAYAVGAGTEGLPDFYQTAFHTEEYIRSRWGAHLEIRSIVGKGLADHQDIVVCRRPG
jgi:SAM-dependent methyltransferase